MNEQSLERALTDLELLQSAYPEEVIILDGDNEDQVDVLPTNFPIRFLLLLQKDTTTFVKMEIPVGYPKVGLRIISYQAGRNTKSFQRSYMKDRLDHVVTSMREVAIQLEQDEMESCFSCCATGLESWENFTHTNDENKNNHSSQGGKKEDIYHETNGVLAVVEFHHMLIGKTHKKEASAISAANQNSIRGWIFMGGPCFAIVTSVEKNDLLIWLQECKRVGKPGEIRFLEEIKASDYGEKQFEAIMETLQVPNKLKVMNYRNGKDSKMDCELYQEKLKKFDIPFPLPS